jgi:hypothetical protein
MMWRFEYHINIYYRKNKIMTIEIKHFVFFGCSFTKGLDSAVSENVVDHPDWKPETGLTWEHEIKYHREENTYPFLVAQDYNVTYENVGHSGNTNEIMAVQAYDWLVGNKNRIDETLCIFAATSPYRLTTTYIPSGRRNIKVHANGMHDRGSLVLSHKHEQDPRMKELQRLMYDEELEYFKTKSFFHIMGVRQMFKEFKANHIILNMLYPFDKDYVPEIKMFDSDNQNEIVGLVDNQSKADTGKKGRYCSPLSRHLNSDGYRVAADIVINNLNDAMTSGLIPKIERF